MDNVERLPKGEGLHVRARPGTDLLPMPANVTTHVEVEPGSVLFAAATALYLLTTQRMICGDGIFFDEMLQADWLLNIHLLLLPLAKVLHTILSVFGDVSYETTMKVLSAVAGGAGVAMTFRVARHVLGSKAQALTAALTLMVLIGYWFHSTATELHALHPACASVLLLGLVRALAASRQGSTSLDRTTLGCCALGSLLTPLSHLSGAAMGVPVLYALFRVSGRLRVQLLLAVAAGLLAFLVIFATLYWGISDFRKLFEGSANAATGISIKGTIAMLKQLLLYAIPASALVPAGLVVLFRTAPWLAWLALSWMVAWPIVVVQHTDFLLGSYHTPTLPVQVILAVVAFSHLARTPLRAILAALLASLPMVGVLARDTAGPAPDNEQATTVLCSFVDDLVLGLWLWLLAAAILVLMVRKQTSNGEARWLPVLWIVTLLLSAPYLLPKLNGDPYRDRIHDVSRLVGERDLVFYLPESFAERNHWRRYFRADNRERGFSPADVHYRDENLKAYKSAVILARQEKRGIWFVGKMDSYPTLIAPRDMKPDKGVLEFFADLRETSDFVRAAGTVEPIFELVPKK